MTRQKDDTNGKGEVIKRLIHNPSVTIPVAVIVAVIIAVYGFAQATADTAARVSAVEDRIDRGDVRLGKSLDNINSRLDDLFALLSLPRRNER